MAFPIKTWLPARVRTIKDMAFAAETAGPGVTLLIRGDLPSPGQKMPELHLYDAAASSVRPIHLFDAIVQGVEMAESPDGPFTFRLFGSLMVLKAVPARLGYGPDHRADRFDLVRTEARVPTDDPAGLPPSWTFAWNIDPGGSWEVGREDGRCGFFPRDGRVMVVSGPDWGRTDLPYPKTASPLTGRDVDALRVWCTSPETPFPDLPGVEARYRPEIDGSRARDLTDALDDIERILAC